MIPERYMEWPAQSTAEDPCDVRLSNDEGERYVQGTAQVALPWRAG